MSISDLTFGNPTYDPVFTVSSGDEGIIRLRSKETAPLSHESLDENFTNIGNKINEILDLKIDQLDIGGDGKLGLANLALTAGSGLDLTSTGQFSHQARPTAQSGWSYDDINKISRRFISGLDFDEFGHVAGYKHATLNFVGTGSITVNQGVADEVTINSNAYSSGDSPSFSSVQVGTTLWSGSDSDHSGSLNLYDESGDTVFDRHWSSGQSDFIIKHNGSAQFTILESGKVGIGTESPSAKLDIVNTSTTTTQSYGLSVRGGGNSAGTGYSLRALDQAGNVDFFVRGDGNVGIGTTSPSKKLSVDGGIHVTQYNKIHFSNSTDQVYINAPATNKFAIYTNNTSRMLVDDVGNVGIGTPSPDQILTTRPVQAGKYGLHVIKPATNDSLGGIFVETDSTTSLYLKDRSKNPQSTVRLKAKGDSYFNGGNVGIGITSPSALLSVFSTGASSSVMRVVRSTSAANQSNYLFNITEESDNHSTLDMQAANGISAIRLRTSGDSYFNGGNVGIGTTSPQQKLDVRGNVRIGHNADITPDDGPEVPSILQIDGNGYQGFVSLDQNAMHIGHNSNVRNLHLSTNETPRLTIRESSGNVGVGTQSPSQKLEVAGHLFVNNGQGIFKRNSASGPLYAEQQGSGPAGVFVGGNVGIGTTDPKHQLDVTGGNIQGSHQIRAKGWYAGNASDGGPATEIGYASGKGWIMAYDRSSSTYSTLCLQASNAVIKLDNTDGKVKISEDGGNNYGVALTSLNYSNYISTGGSTFNGGDVTAGIVIKNSNPVFVLKDTDGGDSNSQSGYISWRDNANTERGYLGFASTTNKVFSIKNEIGGLWYYGDDHAFNTPNGGSILYMTHYGDVEGKKQFRAKGWASSSATGTACEIGLSSDIGYLMAYNRSDSTYREMRVQSGSARLKLTPTDNAYIEGNFLGVTTPQTTFSGDVRLEDGQGLEIGTGADYVLYHSSNNSYLRNYRHGYNTYFQSEASDGVNKAMIYFQHDGNRPYVRLFEHGAERLRTVNGGVKVTGNLEVTGSLTTSSGALPVAVVGGGTLTVGSDYHSQLGNLTSTANTHKYRYQKVGNMVTIHFELSRYANWGFSSGGYASFTGLPFTPKEYSGYANKAVGSYCQNSANHADPRICTIQSGKLYIWAGAGLASYNYNLVGSITYET